MTDHPTFRPVALPAIHLNGTVVATLQREYRALVDAVSATEDALRAATCSGRDFCFQPPEVFQQAQADRREMFRLLAVVRAYAEAWEGRAAAALDLANWSL